ncbi:MAG: glutathione S-transferase N-terminal domain-containing protein [Neomegalonema sp.]|nr:glutathione S-transferase N-terminal domain-containing protein [Neomegalonema sp.]
MTQNPIDLYYWPTPNGWKISIMLEELGLPYATHYINIGKGDQFDAEFLKIAPNNKMPAIVDPDGPGGAPITIFESGAILQYLGRKTGQFYPSDERSRTEVDQWLMWQMGGVGPMAGQAHHFLQYAPEDLPYAKNRYANEVNRLYGVLDKQLEGRDYVAGEYSIADMAIWPWASLWERQGQSEEDIAKMPNFKAWLDRVGSREAVKRGRAHGEEYRASLQLKDDKQAQSVLFNQRAR